MWRRRPLQKPDRCRLLSGNTASWFPLDGMRISHSSSACSLQGPRGATFSSQGRKSIQVKRDTLQPEMSFALQGISFPSSHELKRPRHGRRIIPLGTKCSPSLSRCNAFRPAKNRWQIPQAGRQLLLYLFERDNCSHCTCCVNCNLSMLLCILASRKPPILYRSTTTTTTKGGCRDSTIISRL